MLQPPGCNPRLHPRLHPWLHVYTPAGLAASCCRVHACRTGTQGYSQRCTPGRQAWPIEAHESHATHYVANTVAPLTTTPCPPPQVHPTMARELFAAGFVSCWSELDPGLQEALVRSLEAALAAPTIPPETVTALLNLAEFMEHDDKRLPLDTRTLGELLAGYMTQ